MRQLLSWCASGLALFSQYPSSKFLANPIHSRLRVDSEPSSWPVRVASTIVPIGLGSGMGGCFISRTYITAIIRNHETLIRLFTTRLTISNPKRSRSARRRRCGTFRSASQIED